MSALRRFAADACERAVKTVAQVAVVTITAGPVSGLLDLDWAAVASVSGLAALVSLLTSVASMKLGDQDTASVLPNAGKHAAE